MKVGVWGKRALGTWLLIEEGSSLLGMTRWEPVLLLHLLGMAAGFLILAESVRIGGKRAADAAR